MVSFDHSCNQIEDKAARNEWNLKSRARFCNIGISYFARPKCMKWSKF